MPANAPQVVDKFCKKCQRTINEKEFYGTTNLKKYPDGKLDMCKKCITMHIDNWDPETFIWILQESDVPWVPDEWNKLLATYGRDKSKMTGATIIGRYFSKMKLKQYKDYRWKDTAFLQELADHKTKEAMQRQGYEASEIASVIEENRKTVPDGDVEIPVYNDTKQGVGVDTPADFAVDDSPDDDIGQYLTEEDRRNMRLKWGKAYRPDEWVQLEQLYQEMLQSYDITAAGDLNSLKIVCKASLKTNQLMDIGDIEGAQKMSKVYDATMKSGKWTAAQNKEEKNDFIDSVGELVAMCEQQGFIAKFYTDTPNDKVDITIADMKRYTKELIEGETNLGDLIEMAIKKNAREDEEANKSEETELVEDEDLFADEPQINKDIDYSDFEDFVEEEREQDGEYLNGIE